MFILSKILSSGVNVPEPCKLPASYDTYFQCGTALTLRDGRVYNTMGSDIPTHIAGENFKENQAEFITCYPILPNMIFETTLIDSPTDLSVGSKIGIGVKSGYASGVSAASENKIATIFDMNGAKASGDKIYIRFI